MNYAIIAPAYFFRNLSVIHAFSQKKSYLLFFFFRIFLPAHRRFIIPYFFHYPFRLRKNTLLLIPCPINRILIILSPLPKIICTDRISYLILTDYLSCR